MSTQNLVKNKDSFLIRADVWSVVSEVTDVTCQGKPTYSTILRKYATGFRIDGKAGKNETGFEELYVKLYGDGAFAKLLMDFEEEVES